ncbi:forkhead box protein M1 isoform X2 [Erpetoichthys calabaricus]|uniref:forkhead box protein M1 isoform X2 n=1 Tax=Erpetoichthys calabaricus TaxID=27687 RepID=UPI0010A0BFA8|nr:forkhead box protein M1 isoform X2 [Erpetoichthys calabaricus]
MISMKKSPKRPLILKRKKLSLTQREDNASKNEQDSKQGDLVPLRDQKFPDGIRIMDHPSMPNTQVVVIPKTADLQSVIGALTAKGKQCGPQGPNKFILLSSAEGSVGGDRHEISKKLEVQTKRDSQVASDGTDLTLYDTLGMSKIIPEHANSSGGMERNPDEDIQGDSSVMDDSLTNIQWLGTMNTDGLPSYTVKKEAAQENISVGSQTKQADVEIRDSHTLKEQQHERPPYSYMAMIQFAINSKKDKKMTLKEIYTWIEEHFPYFRQTAKPGWKNSIRHNLSLHDMFVRETTADGKISFWTIRPGANRCLTLDQVYKPAESSASPPMLTVQICEQKSTPPELTQHQSILKVSEKRMKPLLPRAGPYLIPIQPLLVPPLLMSPTTQLSLHTNQNAVCGLGKTNKKVRIAPKVTAIPSQNPKEMKKDNLPTTPKSQPSLANSSLLSLDKTKSSSRRKQRLVLPIAEEPVILFPESSMFDSGVSSDLSTLQDTQLESPIKKCTFKTPIKGSHPDSSTPSKFSEEDQVLSHHQQAPWKFTPLKKEDENLFEFSPIRTEQCITLPEDTTGFSFSSTPFKDVPFFDSPTNLINSPAMDSLDLPSGSLPESSKPRRCSRELQIGTPGKNRSVTEGLVLDTMNDSLSKILVDVSFTWLEDEELGMGNISWSHLIPELT